VTDVPGFRPVDDRFQHLSYSIKYDYDKGEMSLFDGFVTEQIKVRMQLQEEALRSAVIIELERLGYTVLSPDSGEEGDR